MSGKISRFFGKVLLTDRFTSSRRALTRCIAAPPESARTRSAVPDPCAEPRGLRNPLPVHDVEERAAEQKAQATRTLECRRDRVLERAGDDLRAAPMAHAVARQRTIHGVPLLPLVAHRSLGPAELRLEHVVVPSALEGRMAPARAGTVRVVMHARVGQ